MVFPTVYEAFDGLFYVEILNPETELFVRKNWLTNR